MSYQRAMEEVYWRHRIWPKERPDPKQSLDAVMSQALLERKVTDYLRNSQALEDYWHRPITADQLQAEMERMATHTKQPEVLREIFAALGNDPFVIAECLARPVLAERLITELYAHDQRFHGELKRRAEAELQGHQSIEQMKQLSGDYSEVELVRSDSVQEQADHSHEHSLKLHSHEWDKTVQKLAAPFNKSSAGNASAFGERRSRPVGTFESADMSAHSRNSPADTYETIPMGKRSSIQEDETLYYAVAVMKKGKDRLKLATIAWVKEPLRSWVAKAETQVPVTMAALSANYTLPVIASPLGGCTRPWTDTSTTNAPDARGGHTAVWTGSEMIVWGGAIFGPTFFNTGGRYNPTTDSWTATSTTNAPAATTGHTAVWTGSEMIIWGGNFGGQTGGRYNPGTDSWTATSTTNAPS
ncbi:MAG TPA: hypothetical protein VE176_03960, partial [Candidatus Limnocylindrales bacterium]|nr:hypothetical protein [Candidatus Limnocylindrales bacterium]